MEPNKELIFEVMVMFPDLLQESITSYNNFFKTDFEIIEIINDEVIFCKIKVTKFEISDIFDLGSNLAIKQFNKRGEEKYNW